MALHVYDLYFNYQGHYFINNSFIQEPPVVPVTFLTPTSYARLKGYEGMSSLNSSFAFRTYEQNGLMFYHPFSSSGYVAVSYIL